MLGLMSLHKCNALDRFYKFITQDTQHILYNKTAQEHKKTFFARLSDFFIHVNLHGVYKRLFW